MQSNDSPTSGPGAPVPATGVVPADPDELLAPLNKPKLLPALVLAIVGHVVLVGALSIGYIRDAASYGTLDVRAAKQAEAEEQVERERDETRQAARAGAPKGSPGDDTRVQEIVGGGTGTLSPIEEEVNETSDERPEESNMDLGEILDDLD